MTATRPPIAQRESRADLKCYPAIVDETAIDIDVMMPKGGTWGKFGERSIVGFLPLRGTGWRQPVLSAASAVAHSARGALAASEGQGLSLARQS
jgi:hypothetical protein